MSDLATQKSGSPKHVVISDIVSVSISGMSSPSPPPVYHPATEKPNSILKRDTLQRTEAFDQSPRFCKTNFQTSFVAREETPATKPSVDDPESRPVAGVQEGMHSSSAVQLPSETLPPPPSPPPSPPPPPAPPSSSSYTSLSSIRPQKVTLTVETGNSAAISRNTSSSESPEWPSPPEPLTPQTPVTPSAAGHISFDSDVIQRMLRSLPASPLDPETSKRDFGFTETCATPAFGVQHQDGSQTLGPPTAEGRRASRLARTKSLNVHDRSSVSKSLPRKQQSVDSYNSTAQTSNPGVGLRVGRGDRSERNHERGDRPRRFNKLALEKELRKRNKNIAATYPDSGICLTGDNAPSVTSQVSGRSEVSWRSGGSRPGESLSHACLTSVSVTLEMCHANL